MLCPQVPQLFFSEPSPLSKPRVPRIRVGFFGFDASLKGFARPLFLAEFEHGLSQKIQALGIIGPALGVALKGTTRLLVPPCRRVRRPDFAPDVILRKLTVSGYDRIEMLQGVLQTG